MFGLRRKLPHRADEEGLITIAVGMPMPGEERATIGAALGPGYRVVDICEAPLDTALIVVGPCSAGAMRMLHRTFPHAGVLVLEREASTTWGPVISALRAGAIAYVVAGAEPNSLTAPHAA
jgi:hypothetical protein